MVIGKNNARDGIIPAIEKRCSTRKFTEEQIEPVKLNLILEAARMAPSGMNERGNRIYVFDHSDVIMQLNQSLIHAINNGNVDGINAVNMQSVQNENFHFCYHAPVFLLTTYTGDEYNAFVNAGCLLENAMLQAAELNIGSCFINMGRRASKDPDFRKLLVQFGVDETEIITGGLALGYPQNGFVKHKKSDGNDVIYCC